MVSSPPVRAQMWQGWHQTGAGPVPVRQGPTRPAQAGTGPIGLRAPSRYPVRVFAFACFCVFASSLAFWAQTLQFGDFWRRHHPVTWTYVLEVSSGCARLASP